MNQARAIRGELDNLRNRKTGVIKNLASLDSKSFGRGGSFGSWSQAMSKVLSLMSSEKQSIRKEG